MTCESLKLFANQVYNMTGTRAAFEKFGNVWSYENCPRSRIFARDHSTIKDIPTFQRVMRSNDYNVCAATLLSLIRAIVCWRTE